MSNPNPWNHFMKIDIVFEPSHKLFWEYYFENIMCHEIFIYEDFNFNIMLYEKSTCNECYVNEFLL